MWHHNVRELSGRVCDSIIDVSSEDWIADLEYEERNNAKSCQVCIQRGY